MGDIRMIAPKSTAAVIKQSNVPEAPAQNEILALLSSAEVKARFHEVMTDKSMVDRFIGVLNHAAQTTPKLLQCSKASVMAAMLKCATLRLEPNDPIRQQCFLIPRWNGKTKRMECSWEIGYKGLIELAYRSNEVGTIAFSEIYERDIFEVELGTNSVSHKLPKTDRFKRGAIEAYWAQWVGKDGTKGRPVIMTVADMEEHRDQYAQSYKDEQTRAYSPWTTAFDQMALKTVIKYCLKSAPISAEDLRRGLDESDPHEKHEYQMPGMLNATPSHAYLADPMQISPEAFQARTIDAEYESQPAAPEPEPPKPAAPAPEPAATAPDIDEQHRQEWLQQVKQLVIAKGITNRVLLEKTGMTASMIEREATLAELQKFYKDLSQ